MTDLRSTLATSGPIDLSTRASDETPGFEGKKKDAKRRLPQIGEELMDAQELLFANGIAGTTDRKVLILLQGMDTSGKGGTLRHAAGLVDPQGLAITAFKAPTDEEREHDFLWRIEKHLPAPGMIGVFDRSHYEDVLVGRVRALASAEEIERRYGAINDFEERFVDGGGVLLKCFLHISPDDQEERLAARLDDPTKYWKYNPGDLDDRQLWPEYQAAYETVLERCSTDHAPWHVVPSGRKWYRNWAVATMLGETLTDLGLDWPRADFDVAEQRRRLATM
ncbi:polyphosphate kinase 2 family protein [Aeromicrobium sp. 636]|uniref:Polyphosphate kinase 2 family protein n=1 Tax=Aeromicrobium senzhongii TaxID=2663859 RepID=A0A8I0JYW9_9ACTN|nr:MULTISPECIES: PPK2 family polyphosphate kinase [Aeromicrobium]MBC9225337.1 polyphosphate kinase 2 family protein [Aeromicrobium senzhongii]MCQ3997447.1 polyphosphate kinase 2 family protein [Aeromicrobium sp. 636]MTB87377.1 polyphosphate kinase 2 family protein [Aeromicrobium senzhongii]QNL95565.1 polyphosphate kinase 2 family protein [Aeromicrobium senzhongii]